MKKVESMSAEFDTTFAMENGEIVIGGPKPGTPEARRGFEIERASRSARSGGRDLSAALHIQETARYYGRS